MQTCEDSLNFFLYILFTFFKGREVLLGLLTHFVNWHFKHGSLTVTSTLLLWAELPCCYRVECLIQNIVRHRDEYFDSDVNPQFLQQWPWTFIKKTSGPAAEEVDYSGAASMCVRRYRVGHTCWSVNRLCEGQLWCRLFTSYTVLKEH